MATHASFVWNQRWEVLRPMQKPQHDNRASSDAIKNEVIRISPQWPHPHLGCPRKTGFGPDLRMGNQQFQCPFHCLAEAIGGHRIRLRQTEDNLTVVLQKAAALKKLVSHAVDESSPARTPSPRASGEKAQSVRLRAPFAPSTNHFPSCDARLPE